MGLVAFRFMVLSIMLRVMERIALSSDAMKPWFSSDSEATNQWFALASDCNNWWIALNSDGITKDRDSAKAVQMQISPR